MAKAKSAAAPAADSTVPQFTLDGKTYEVVIPKMIIPGIGQQTAADVCANKAAQQYLVKVQSSAIKELEA